MVDDRQSRVSTDDLLAAGWELIQEELGWKSGSFSPESDDSVPAIFRSIRARDVIAKRKVSPGAFYRRWPDVASYISSLIAFALDRKRHEPDYLVRALVAFDAAAGSGHSIPDIVREVTHIDLTVTSESIEFAIQLHFWSLCRRYPPLRRLLAKQYAEVDRAWQVKYAATMGLLGWRLRPALSVADLTAIITALADGLAIRRVLDPGLATEDLMASGVMAIVVAAVDWDRRGLRLDEWLDELASR